MRKIWRKIRTDLATLTPSCVAAYGMSLLLSTLPDCIVTNKMDNSLTVNCKQVLTAQEQLPPLSRNGFTARLLDFSNSLTLGAPIQSAPIHLSSLQILSNSKIVHKNYRKGVMRQKLTKASHVLRPAYR